MAAPEDHDRCACIQIQRQPGGWKGDEDACWSCDERRGAKHGLPIWASDEVAIQEEFLVPLPSLVDAQPVGLARRGPSLHDVHAVVV